MKTTSKMSLLGLASCLTLASMSFSSTELVVYLYAATALACSGYAVTRILHKGESKNDNSKPHLDSSSHSEKFEATNRKNEKSVLLVDDEEDILDTIEFAFNQIGVSVIKASNAHDALAIIAKDHVSVVVSDICMSGMGGYDLARAIKSDVTNPPTVFLMSGKVDLSQEKAIESGARAMLTKFDIESALVHTVVTELQSQGLAV